MINSSKEAFVTEISGLIPPRRLQAYAEKRNDAGGRLICTLIEIKAWGYQKSRREGTLVYLRIRSLADWIKTAYEERHLNEETRSMLEKLSVEQILQMVWEAVPYARTPEELIDDLHASRYIPSSPPLVEGTLQDD